jgi:hypothetical protein
MIARQREIARMKTALRMRPVGMDSLWDLVDAGDLDPAILGHVPTGTLQGGWKKPSHVGGGRRRARGARQ